MSYTGFKLETETNMIRPVKILSSKVAVDSPTKFTAIGDVGILTAFDGFDFLFNICRTLDAPINLKNFLMISRNPTEKFANFENSALEVILRARPS